MGTKKEPPEPKGTEELITHAYEAELPQMRKDIPTEDFELHCPKNVRVTLRIIDHMVRQRILEHHDREPHHSPRTLRGHKPSPARACRQDYGKLE